MLIKDGVATFDQVISKFPELDILSKPKAIIECYENIACNPCSTSCPFNAITIGEDINNIPKVDVDVDSGYLQVIEDSNTKEFVLKDEDLIVKDK